MKLACLGFVVSFVVGYTAFFWHNIDRYSVMTDRANRARESTSREHSLSAEYQELMLDEEEQFQISLEKANRLTELLGLAEKMNQDDYFDSFDYPMLANKLARLFPQAALDYYEPCPTDAAMNQTMYWCVLEKWANLDFKACISYLVNKPNFRSMEFEEWWTKLANHRMESHPQDCIDAFQGFSKELQRDLMEKSDMSDELLEALLPVVKDQQLVAETKEKLAQERQRHEEQAKSLAEEKKNAQHMIASQVEKLRSSWEKEWPTSDVIIESIRALGTRSERRQILDSVTPPRQDPNEEPQDWIERISKVMQEVGDAPSSAPKFPPGEEEAYRKVLADWLPKQSTEMQRSWAESVVQFQDTQEAMVWVEQLNTKSLRHDMRDFAWERSVATDPKDAATALMQQATPQELEIHLPNAVYGWAKHDYAAAKQWLDTQPNSEAKSQALEKIEVK
jgi:hypothetical protein